MNYAPLRRIRYKGKIYTSLIAFYNDAHAPDVTLHAFYTRVHNGMPPLKAATKALRKGPRTQHRYTYKGVEYLSMAKLYDVVKREIRKTCHRKPCTSYATFIHDCNHGGIDYAIEHMHKLPKKPFSNCLVNVSRKLDGADNLVCQRMTKLGWSYEKAISTPRDTNSLPKKCRWKGKTYRSITACFKAIKPNVSYPRFCNVLKEKGCLID